MRKSYWNIPNVCSWVTLQLIINREGGTTRQLSQDSLNSVKHDFVREIYLHKLAIVKCELAQQLCPLEEIFTP